MINSIFWGDFTGVMDDGTVCPSPAFAVAEASAVKKNLSAIVPDQEVLLFVTTEALQKDVAEFSSICAQYRKMKAVLVYEKANAAQNLAWLEKFPPIVHVIPKNSEDSRRFWSQPAALKSQSSTLRERYEMEIVNSGQCESVYSPLADYCLKQDCFMGFDNIVQTAASELITNAFYNGKRNPATGEPLVSDRRVKYELDPGERITVTYGRDDNHLWLIVRDCFGSLDRATLISALNRAARERKPKLDSGGGAGLGLFMVYDWATEMIVTLEQGQSTEFACKFKLTKRNKVFEQEFSAIHIL